MHVIVIGGSGFLGSNLIRHLSLLSNYSITNIDSKNYNFAESVNYRATFLSSEEEIDEIFGDIKNNYQGDVTVIHLAGMADKALCDKFPKKAIFSNVILTSYLLKACKKYNFNKFVFASSGLTYERKKTHTYREDNNLAADSIYTASKIAGEKVVEGFSLSSNMKSFVVRMANVYGAESNKNTFFGTIFDQILKGNKKISILNPYSCSDFVYIKDVVRCLGYIINSSLDSEFNIYNISSGQSYSTAGIVDKVCAEMNFPQQPFGSLNTSKDGCECALSNEKIAKELGWIPEYSIEEGIKDSIFELTRGKLCKKEK